MLKCKIIDPVPAPELTYPCVRLCIHSAPGLVVLFTAPTAGVVLAGTHNWTVGKTYDSFIGATNTNVWAPCTVELS